MIKNGGYEDGYEACDYFWGTDPAKYVTLAKEYLKNNDNLTALDLGCGDGKNSNYLDSNNFNVTSVDISSIAISNAKRLWDVKNVEWIVGDITKFIPPSQYDLVLATGSPHCLSTKKEVSTLIKTMINSTKEGGYIVFYSFNDADNDFSGHNTDFTPILLSHTWYLSQFSNLKVLQESNIVQKDKHPNNSIEHHHSITRILLQKI